MEPLEQAGSPIPASTIPWDPLPGTSSATQEEHMESWSHLGWK